MKKRILIIASSTRNIGPNNRPTGNFLTEIGHPYETFKNQGYDVDIVSIQGGEAPLDGMADKDEPLNVAFLNGDGLEKMKHTKKVDAITTDDYDAVFVPGGLAPMADMPENETVHSIIADFYERGDIVGAVCHGPVSLLNVKLKDGSFFVKGRKLTSFSNAEEENYAKADVPFLLESALEAHGAIYSADKPWQPYVVEDGRLVTGQNPASAKGVAEHMIALLEK
jgi:putative intracellular protease/amidase